MAACLAVARRLATDRRDSAAALVHAVAGDQGLAQPGCPRSGGPSRLRAADALRRRLAALPAAPPGARRARPDDTLEPARDALLPPPPAAQCWKRSGSRDRRRRGF